MYVCVMEKKEQFFCVLASFLNCFRFFYYVDRWVEEGGGTRMVYFFFSRINLTKTKETIFFFHCLFGQWESEV